MSLKDDLEMGVLNEKEAQDIDSPKLPKEGIVLTKEECEKYRIAGQELIDSYQRFFKTFAKDVSLKFVLSDAFKINYESGEVHMDTRWFAEKELSKDQIIWAMLHELSHFRDFSEDPEATLGQFDYIRKQAEQTASFMLDICEQKLGISDPEYLDEVRRGEAPKPKKTVASGEKSRPTMTPIQMVAYKIHHTFYNILDDIYVNNIVSRKAPKYEEERAGGQEVKALYREKLFKDTDYSKLPRHLQFIYSLLRSEMVKDEEVIISDEVKEIMNRRIKFKGKEYTVLEMVEKLIKPRGGRDTKPKTRYFAIQNTLEPIFNELLKKDLEEWNPKKPDEEKEQNNQSEDGSDDSQGKGEQSDPSGEDEQNQKGKSENKGLNPFEEEYEKFDESNPDSFNEEDIEKWIKDKQEEEKEGDEDKTATAKAKEAQEAMDKQWAKDKGIRPETLKKFRDIETEIEPYLQELSELWRYIVLGSTPVISRGKEGYFKTGELDVSKVIEEWPKIGQQDFDDVRVMKRTVSKEGLIQKPELIRVRLVGDMSGSMAGDAEKVHVLQQCFVLILSSLREFNTYLNMSRQQTGSRMAVDTEAWTFGTSYKKIKSFRNESGRTDEQTNILKVFDHLESNMGLTYDDRPLGAILNSLTQFDKDKISKEKILDIVIEITDGASSNPGGSRRIIDSLDEAGVIVKAFQIGNVSLSDKLTFNEIWNDGRANKRGEVVGKSIANLLPAITLALKKYFGNVRL